MEVRKENRTFDSGAVRGGDKTRPFDRVFEKQVGADDSDFIAIVHKRREEAMLELLTDTRQETNHDELERTDDAR